MISKEIRYMLAIRRYGSTTKAVDPLLITQSVLSEAVKNTERQSGSPLFSHIGSDLIPTRIGNRYMDYAEKICQICSDWNSECEDLLDKEKGQLTIAVVLMRGSCLLPDVLSRSYSRYPDVQTSLLEESYSVEKQLMLSLNVDFAIYNSMATDPAQTVEHLGQEEIVLVVAPGHPLAEKAIVREGFRYPWVDIRHTEHEPYILHPRDQTTGRISAGLFKKAGLTSKALLFTRNSDIAIRLAASDTALCLVPESYIRKIHLYNPPLRFSVGDLATVTTLYVAYQKGRYIPPYGRYLTELVEENYRQQEGLISCG